MEQKKSGLGIASLILGIIGFLTGFFVIGILFDIIAIILGIIAFASKKNNKGLAIGGVVVSATSIILVIIIFSLGLGLNMNKKETTKLVDTNVQVEETKEVEVQQDGTEEKSEKIETQNDGTDSTTFSVGDIVETEDFIIQYLSCEDYVSDNMFIKPEDGFKFIQLAFDFENTSDSDQSVSTFGFEGYADGYAMEQIYIDTDLSATLSSGKKTKGTVTFEVPIEASEIQIEYETNFWNDEKITFIAQ
ncbi:MAG: DUF4190 domain-containing protein [Mobilitalea sp.]